MNALTPITAEIDAATMKLVDELARARGITGAAFAAEAIQRAAEHEAEERAFVQAGIDAADRGDVIDQDVIETWFEERVAARRSA